MDPRKYYRHLLLGPFRVYRIVADAPEKALALLCSPPHELNTVYRELADDFKLITNPAIIEAATLYTMTRMPVC